MFVETAPIVRVQETQPSLPALTENIGAGDPSAFEELFRQYHTPLVRYACRFTRDEEAAYDILQDVFMRLWEKRDELTVHTSLQGLLYTMVRNSALNRNRDTGKFVGMPDELPDELISAPSADKDLETRDLSERIRNWIAELPPRRAEAFVLSRFHGLKHKDIAAIMKVSKRTVDTHILLALQFLRTRLDAMQDDGGRL